MPEGKTKDGTDEPPEIIPELQTVATYAHTSIEEVLNYPIDKYRAYLRAAVINNMKQTKEGREYLRKAKRLTITTIDDEQFNKFMGSDDKKWLST